VHSAIATVRGPKVTDVVSYDSETLKIKVLYTTSSWHMISHLVCFPVSTYQKQFSKSYH